MFSAIHDSVDQKIVPATIREPHDSGIRVVHEPHYVTRWPAELLKRVAYCDRFFRIQSGHG